MEALPVREGKKKRRTRVGFCVGLGIGLGGWSLVGLVVWLENRPQSPDTRRPPAAAAKLREFTARLQTYRMAAGDYPSQEQGLMALVERPEVEPVPERWKPQFKKLPKDPWGREYRYFYPGRSDPARAEVVSDGEDLEFGTDDDISSQHLE